MPSYTDPQLMQAGSKGLINLNGHVVTKEFSDFMHRLKNYDENLELACLDGQMAELMDAPFVILERCKDGNLRKVFSCWELNEQVFERISRADSSGRDILAMLDKNQKQMDDEVERRYKDRQEENIALVTSIVHNLHERERSSYTFKDEDTGEKATIYPDRPSKRE